MVINSAVPSTYSTLFVPKKNNDGMTWHLVAISYHDGNKFFEEEPDLPFSDLATDCPPY